MIIGMIDMSFVDFSNRIPEIINYKDIDDVILNLDILRICSVNNFDINQCFHSGRVLLECTLDTFQ